MTEYTTADLRLLNSMTATQVKQEIEKIKKFINNSSFSKINNLLKNLHVINSENHANQLKIAIQNRIKDLKLNNKNFLQIIKQKAKITYQQIIKLKLFKFIFTLALIPLVAVFVNSFAFSKDSVETTIEFDTQLNKTIDIKQIPQTINQILASNNNIITHISIKYKTQQFNMKNIIIIFVVIGLVLLATLFYYGCCCWNKEYGQINQEQTSLNKQISRMEELLLDDI